MRGRARVGVRYPAGAVNKTEAAYARFLSTVPGVESFAYEPVKLRLAKATFYTPDFMVVLSDGGIEMHEVKGFWRDDARVKIKVAAEQFPWFRFRAVTKVGMGWNFEDF